MKAFLRHLLSLVAVAGFALALWPAAGSAYAHWSQDRLQNQWQAAAKASQSHLQTLPNSSPSPRIGWAPQGDRAVRAAGGEGAVGGSRSRPWPPTRIIAPQIDLDASVVQGVQASDLRRGPGHDPATVLPGQVGNCIIAGHRNIYGSYLFKIDTLSEGSLITLKTPRDSYKYYVTSVYTVPDSNLTPYEATDAGVRQLTILSCTLPHSDERLVINAQM